MKRKFMALIVAAITLTGIGCQQEKFEISTDDKGRTVRLNKRTGEAEIILANGNTIRVKSPEELEIEKNEQNAKNEALREPINWNTWDIASIGVDEVSVKTAWFDQKIHYQVSIKPVPKNYGKSYSSTPFTLKFYDENGFGLLDVDIYSHEITRFVDDEGKAQALSVKSSHPCSAENYRNFANMSMTWSF